MTQESNMEETGRAKRLKQATQEAHQRLDEDIMAAQLFSARERYALFLEIQQRFHRDIDALYLDQSLAGWLPDLKQRRRLPLIEQDMADLGLSLPSGTPLFQDGMDFPTVLGWLYVSEGSNLGAAFLSKAAARLGLSEHFGARHLAGAPEGRGLSWRNFTEALDAAPLDPSEEAKVIAGAEAAFAHMQAMIDEITARDAAQQQIALA